MRGKWLFFIILLFSGRAIAQAPDGAHVLGKLIFEDGTTRYTQAKIYNRRTGTYITPTTTGAFELFGYKSDTFIFVAQNFQVQTLCYKDSCVQRKYEITVTMHRLTVQMSAIKITPDKSFEQIQQEIDDLGVRNTDTYKDISSFESPISALYEMFSKTEKDKRAVAVLENNDMRQKVQRELLKLCSKANLIDLYPSEYDSFIDYCNFTDEYLQHTNLYDLLSNIKVHYLYYRQHYR